MYTSEGHASFFPMLSILALVDILRIPRFSCSFAGQLAYFSFFVVVYRRRKCEAEWGFLRPVVTEGGFSVVCGF